MNCRCISLPWLALCVLTINSVTNAADTKYAIVIHGGAGSAPTNQEWIANRRRVLDHALETGKGLLESGGSSLDAVESVVRILEDSSYFNAGKGAVFNAAGNHELDATIMDGRDRSAGAVGGVTIVKNPISLARRVMTDTRHILLASSGADQFAKQYADDAMIEIVSNNYYSTDHQRERLQRAQERERQVDSDSIGTVGCVALDQQGNLAAGTSTGGLTNKKFGRLGDSPIAGAGTFADNRTCGVSCTGIGEDFMRNAVAFDISARMAYRGDSMETAVGEILANQERRVRGGIIAIDRRGRIVMQFNTGGMARAAADSAGRYEIHVGP